MPYDIVGGGAHGRELPSVTAVPRPQQADS
jgi:hypothetical protein